MEPLNATATSALRRLLETQPTTPAKVAFAWRIAAGAAMERATEIELRQDGVFVVRSRHEAWRAGIKDGRAVLLRRMQDLLGQDVVSRLDIE